MAAAGGRSEGGAERWRVVVFGGTGFLGSRLVEALLGSGHGPVAVSRHPERGRPPPPGADVQQADVRDEDAVRAVVAGADAVINAVSLYLERGQASFGEIHVEAAERLAARAAAAGVKRLIHLSGIGADARSPSPYIRSRGHGEAAVRAAFPAAVMFRPSVMYGPDDAFLTTLVSMVRRLPILPLFGRGGVRLQPVFVGDVAAAAVRALTADRLAGRACELGGPKIYTYRQLLELVGATLGVRRPLLPVPFPFWELLAAAASLLPDPPLTRDQIALMRRDNVVSPQATGLAELGVTPTDLEAVLASLPQLKRRT